MTALLIGYAVAITIVFFASRTFSINRPRHTHTHTRRQKPVPPKSERLREIYVKGHHRAIQRSLRHVRSSPDSGLPKVIKARGITVDADPMHVGRSAQVDA